MRVTIFPAALKTLSDGTINTHLFACDFGQQQISRLIIAPPGQWIRGGFYAFLLQVAHELVICSCSLGYGH